jgi:transmembrane sensor
MTEEIFRIADLIVKQLRGDLDEQERIVLEKWLSKAENRELWEKLSNEKELNDRMARLHEIDIEAWKKKAYERLFPGIVPMGNRKKLNWKRYLVAASFFLVVMVGVFWATGLFRKEGQETQLKSVVEQNEILPGTDKAVLTLADGSTIHLSASDSSSLTEKNGTLIRNNNGELLYDAKAAGGEVLHNTVSTARGGKFSITLADGSIVWLNAASSLYFPTSFPAKERRVEITGEAWFEVAKKTSQPFIVKVGAMEVEVLGTEFNIMAYSDEELIKTTLVEGSVRVRNANADAGGQSARLIIGEQAQMNRKGEIITAKDVNIEEALAWKNGFVISSNKEDLRVIMRQISRWYGVDVQYEGNINPQDLRVKLPRDIKLSALLKALGISTGLEFEIKDKLVTVKSK